jgi:hypothetical protein
VSDALLELPGRIRYLLKVHKPGLTLRRVEVDTHSPFNNVTIWLSQVLHRVAAKLSTVTADANVVLSDIHYRTFPVAADDHLFVGDLVDYYPRIHIANRRYCLMTSLGQALKAFFQDSPFLARLITNICQVVVDHKYVYLPSGLHRKKRSLSIGERIATDAANIHRHVVFELEITDALSRGLLKKM